MKDHKTVRISCEFYPPKTVEGMENLFHTAKTLAHIQPHFFSVTFGAGGSTRQGTFETVRDLTRKTAVSVAPHLSCVGLNRDELVTILKQYQLLGVNRIVALRGDLPSGMVSNGELSFAYDLVRLIRETTGDRFHIEVAAYPEYHPKAKNTAEDITNLKKKWEAGASSALTQYFFNSDAYFDFVDQCAKNKIFMPIIPGIMPIMQASKLARFSAMCGAEIPRWLSKRLEAYGDDIDSIQAFGADVVAALCERLLAGGAQGLHFYTLNHAELSLKILTHLQLIPSMTTQTQILAAVEEKM